VSYLKFSIGFEGKYWEHVLMEESFWLEKWAKSETGFHQADFNPWLVKYWEVLGLEAGSTVLVPLCGKTRDIDWLLAQGYSVIGVELAETAVRQLFERLGLCATITSIDALQCYTAERLTLYVGDVFALTPELLGSVEAVYDRAALVALPMQMRDKYAAHLVSITHAAPQLLLSFSYDQSKMTGPPFSVDADEVHRLYASHYATTCLFSGPLKEGIKTLNSANESVWHLATGPQDQ
jgi:thiopurine S-methyltransferase